MQENLAHEALESENASNRPLLAGQVEDEFSGVDFFFSALERNKTLRYALAIAAVLVAIISFFVIAPIASSPDTHASTIASLDSKKDTVTTLVGASTGTSAAVTLLPGDACTPIAEKLVDLSSDFLVVLAAIYLEKYLLTILGLVAFKVLVPLACLIFAGAVMIRRPLSLKETLLRLGAKLFLFGICAFLLVPASVGVSGFIEQTYQASIQQTVEAAQQTQSDIESASQNSDSDQEGTDIISDIANTITGGASELTSEAQNCLNDFLESLAVMIVTSCVIPILVLIFFIWLINVLLGFKIQVPNRVVSPRIMRHR